MNTYDATPDLCDPNLSITPTYGHHTIKTAHSWYNVWNKQQTEMFPERFTVILMISSHFRLSSGPNICGHLLPKNSENQLIMHLEC